MCALLTFSEFVGSLHDENHASAAQKLYQERYNAYLLAKDSCKIRLLHPVFPSLIFNHFVFFFFFSLTSPTLSCTPSIHQPPLLSRLHKTSIVNRNSPDHEDNPCINHQQPFILQVCVVITSSYRFDCYCVGLESGSTPSLPCSIGIPIIRFTHYKNSLLHLIPWKV